MSYRWIVCLLSAFLAISISCEKCNDLSTDCSIIAIKCLSPNRIEQKLMELACPFTCGYCSQSRNIPPNEKGCVDTSNDCKNRLKFCGRKFYRRMMSIQCAKSCKFCESDDDSNEEDQQQRDSREINLEKLRNKIGAENVDKLKEMKLVDNVIDLMKTTSSPDVTSPSLQLNCVDKANDCERNSNLCHHKAYEKLFQKICAKTCEFCDKFNDDDMLYDNFDENVSVLDYLK